MEKRKKEDSNNPPNVKPVPESDLDANIWSFISTRETKSWFICISLFAVLIRLAVGLHPYSGAATPPMFGDYEAQRHWMEITLNLPVKEWYRNSTVNDLSYWGLDYPPLTAYQSYFHGIFLKLFDSASVSLFTSRGYESYVGKLLMRWTVLMSDLTIFFPAVLYFAKVYSKEKFVEEKSSMVWHTAMILLNPCLILIDHGHFQVFGTFWWCNVAWSFAVVSVSILFFPNFYCLYYQYNCISLGFTTAAVAAILSDRDLVGSILFTLALNHKQMSAYYAPAFFCYLLGKCLRRQDPILQVSKLGLVVLGTFAIVWWPYLYSVEAASEVRSDGSNFYTVLSFCIVLTFRTICSRLRACHFSLSGFTFPISLMWISYFIKRIFVIDYI